MGFRLKLCIIASPPPAPPPLPLALISNKDEGVALIDIVPNESLSNVSLTFQIPGQMGAEAGRQC